MAHVRERYIRLGKPIKGEVNSQHLESKAEVNPLGFRKGLRKEV